MGHVGFGACFKIMGSSHLAARELRREAACCYLSLLQVGE